MNTGDWFAAVGALRLATDAGLKASLRWTEDLQGAPELVGVDAAQLVQLAMDARGLVEARTAELSGSLLGRLHTGRQSIKSVAEGIAEALTEDDFVGLEGKALPRRDVPSLRWDSVHSARQWAYSAQSTAKTPYSTAVGADWLALHAPGALLTTLGTFIGERYDHLYFPTWSDALTLPELRDLMESLRWPLTWRSNTVTLGSYHRALGPANPKNTPPSRDWLLMLAPWMSDGRKEPLVATDRAIGRVLLAQGVLSGSEDGARVQIARARRTVRIPGASVGRPSAPGSDEYVSKTVKLPRSVADAFIALGRGAPHRAFTAHVEDEAWEVTAAAVVQRCTDRKAAAQGAATKEPLKGFRVSARPEEWPALQGRAARYGLSMQDYVVELALHLAPTLAKEAPEPAKVAHLFDWDGVEDVEARALSVPAFVARCNAHFGGLMDEALRIHLFASYWERQVPSILLAPYHAPQGSLTVRLAKTDWKRLEYRAGLLRLELEDYIARVIWALYPKFRQG